MKITDNKFGLGDLKNSSKIESINTIKEPESLSATNTTGTMLQETVSNPSNIQISNGLGNSLISGSGMQKQNYENNNTVNNTNTPVGTENIMGKGIDNVNLFPSSYGYNILGGVKML